MSSDKDDGYNRNHTNLLLLLLKIFDVAALCYSAKVLSINHFLLYVVSIFAMKIISVLIHDSHSGSDRL